MNELQAESAAKAHSVQVCTDIFVLSNRGHFQCMALVERWLSLEIVLPEPVSAAYLDVIATLRNRERFDRQCRRFYDRLKNELRYNSFRSEECATLLMDFSYRAKYYLYLQLSKNPQQIATVPDESAKARRVRNCYRDGAITEWLMQQCMQGERVNQQNFVNCVSGVDLCLGEQQPRPIVRNGTTGGGYYSEGSSGELIWESAMLKAADSSYIFLYLRKTPLWRSTCHPRV